MKMNRRSLLRSAALRALTAAKLTRCNGPVPAAAPKLSKRWLFVWRDLTDPKEVARLIAHFPRAQKDGYSGIVFSAAVAPESAPALRQAAKAHGLALIAIVMGNCPDRNYYEGVLAKDGASATCNK